MSHRQLRMSLVFVILLFHIEAIMPISYDRNAMDTYNTCALFHRGHMGMAMVLSCLDQFD